jgi:fructose-1-phosphate kinase PfkB-like protein
MNRDEFMQAFHLKDCSFEETVKNVGEIRQRYAPTSLVITCGQDGIISSTPQGLSITRGPVLAAVNAAGAGDAVSAGLMWRLSLGDDWNTALRWAAAAGSASVLTEATGELEIRTVEELYPQIKQTIE